MVAFAPPPAEAIVSAAGAEDKVNGGNGLVIAHVVSTTVYGFNRPIRPKTVTVPSPLSTSVADGYCTPNSTTPEFCKNGFDEGVTSVFGLVDS